MKQTTIKVSLQNIGLLTKERYVIRIDFGKRRNVSCRFTDLTVRKVIKKEMFKSTL